MSYREHLSVGGFLLEHFESHKDVSHGLFSSGEIDFTMAACRVAGETGGDEEIPAEPFGIDEDFLQITTNIWLAPFDFGIMQKVAVAFCKSAEEPGFLEIRVRLERLAGEANSWRRINKVFLHQFRKQLLIWRSLDADAKKHYEQLILTEGRAKGLESAMAVHAPGEELPIRGDG